MCDTVEARVRATPTITSPKDSHWGWREVQKRKRKAGVLTWLRLLGRRWETVCAPPGVPCAVKNLRGQGLYHYKRLGQHAYLLRMEPSPGFPGG